VVEDEFRVQGAASRRVRRFDKALSHMNGFSNLNGQRSKSFDIVSIRILSLAALHF
jgi:hypothetical protein